MLVAEILKRKGDAVFTMSPGETVAKAATLLHERRVGAMVVLGEHDKVVGIVSERDIVRVLAKSGPPALDGRVADCMTTEVIFAQPGETVDELLGRMTDRRIRHLPVCRGERLVGIVSIGDLVKAKIAEVEAESRGLKDYISAA